ncbi:unnamed protein product [Hymenolepis diminuta]|uniref:Integrase catalytic domain-containing protein n=1 Tax=Hymenolepis diminuta TaxID=6216 RepID=A0A564XVE3_HYMDI|nr:unnamed protein product [Hymenolepis diminuta]
MSVDFKEFCGRQLIEHIRTPPYHPQSNGQTKRFVDTPKSLTKKRKGRKPWKRYFRILAETQINSTSSIRREIPEVLMGQKLRTVHEAMLPKKILPDGRRCSQNSGLAVNTPVCVRDYQPSRQWTAAIIINRHESMIYDVEFAKDTSRVKDQIMVLSSAARTGMKSSRLQVDLSSKTYR